MREDLGGDLDAEIGAGRLGPLLEWLRERVHRIGALEDAEPLVRRVTGSGLTSGPYLDYLWDKFGPLYGVERPRPA
jgi:carboxypeptidase Taq